MTKKKRRPRRMAAPLLTIDGGKQAQRAYEIIDRRLGQAIEAKATEVGVELTKQLGAVGAAPVTITHCTFQGTR